MAKRKQNPCSALADIIWPSRSAFETVSSPVYPQIDLHPLLVLLMQRLTDDAADDAGIEADFCASFHLDPKAVMAAIRAYRQALGATVH